MDFCKATVYTEICKSKSMHQQLQEGYS